MKQEIVDAIKEIHQSRSEFQLKYFVVGQHDTDEMSYVQTLLEIDDMSTAEKKLDIRKRRLEIEIERLKATGDELDALDAEEKQVDLEKVLVSLNGIKRELSILENIWDSFSKKYTRAEIEETQPEYWKARLIRQASLEALGNSMSVSWANLDSLRQINELDNVINEAIENSKKAIPGDIK